MSTCVQNSCGIKSSSFWHILKLLQKQHAIFTQETLYLSTLTQTILPGITYIHTACVALQVI